MRPGWIARRCIAAIERYRYWGDGRGSGCRFEPSCSTFALEALRKRALPLALASSGWRLVRCTPLVRSGSNDPVKRPRARLRAGSARTLSTIALLAGLLLLGLASSAMAQGITGGCTATLGGRSPGTLTRTDPLLVAQGQVVDVTGQAPAGSTPGATSTVVVVKVLEGIAGADVVKDFSGQGTSWGGEADVDAFLRWGLGLYRVEATGAGPGWSCTATGYVKLDGNPLSKTVGQVAGGLAVAGGVGVVLSSRPRREPDASPTAQEVKDQFGRDVDSLTGPPKKLPIWERDLKGTLLIQAGCLFFLLGPMALEPAISKAPSTAPGAVAAVGPGKRQRVWVHGHPAWGAMSGFGLGLGIAVLGQQFALWPLTLFTAVAFPCYAAVVGGVRAYIGQPWTSVGPVTPAAPAAPPMPPPAAPPMP